MSVEKFDGILAITLICASVAPFGVSAAGKNSPAKSVVHIKKFVESGKKQLSLRLKDPASVRFRDLSLMEQIGSNPPSYTLCGLFNAKNSYGGYGDEEQFYVAMTSTGAVDKVWLMDNRDPPQEPDEGNLTYINRKYEYKRGQLLDIQERCDSTKGKIKAIWSQ